MHETGSVQTISLPWLACVASGALCVSGGLTPSLQPLLLSAMANSGHITLPQIGEAAMVEGLAMALATGFAGFFLPARAMRALALASSLAAAVANSVTPMLSGEALFAARAVNGICGALMLWQALQIIARIHMPGRFLAMIIVAQACSLALLSVLMSSVLLPVYGAAGGYFCLVALNLIMLPAAVLIPDSLPALPGGAKARYRVPDVRGFLGLAAILLQLAAIMSLWVYLPIVAERLGQSSFTMKTAISAALAAQIIAGVAAFVLAPKLSPAGVLAGCLIAGIISIGILQTVHIPMLFIAAIVIFGFAWIFAFAFQAPFLIAIDPSRAAVMLVLSAQLLGQAAGSLVASRIDIAFVPHLSVGLFAASLVALFGARLSWSGKHARGPASFADRKV